MSQRRVIFTRRTDGVAFQASFCRWVSNVTQLREFDDVEEQTHTVKRDTYYTEALVRRKQLAARTECSRQSAPAAGWSSSIVGPTRRSLVPERFS
jgi:hypothetical protein